MSYHPQFENAGLDRFGVIFGNLCGWEIIAPLSATMSPTFQDNIQQCPTHLGQSVATLKYKCGPFLTTLGHF
jgi:hypothetical protein